MAQETVAGQDAAAPAEPAVVPRWRRRAWGRGVAAALSGLMIFLAFPPNPLAGHGSVNGWWPLAVPGVALFTLAVKGARARTGAWLGLINGLVFFLALLDWAKVIGWDAWAGLSLVEALYLAPMGAAIAVVTRHRGWPLWTALLWVGQEAVRGRWPLGGLPWGRLAFSQTASPLTPYAALGGAPLVSFATALAGGLLALAVLRSPLPAALAGRLDGAARGLWVAGGSLAGLVAVFGLGFAVPVPTSGTPVTVAVIQGNVPRPVLADDAQIEAVLQNHLEQTYLLAHAVTEGKVAKPSIVIWPENADDEDPYRDPQARARIQAAVNAIGVPVLVGAVINAPNNADKVQNRGIVWYPNTGPGDYYVKRHPVPFGEYIPMRSLLTKFIKRLALIPRDFEAGTRAGNLQLGPVRIGDVICFEIAYDSIVRDVAGSQVLVVQTNNATYGHTSQPWQQLAMSRLRAVEHGRSVLIAATSGVSGVIAPDGKVIDSSKEFTPYTAVATVPERTAETLADRLGSSLEWLLTAAGVAVLALFVVRARRGLRSGR